MDERVREAGARGSQLSEVRYTWRAQPGPQTALIKCPIGDVFFGGSRGGGKTDGLLGDFGLHAGKYGKDAKGILFRRTLSELDEVITRSHEIYGPLGWVYQVQKGVWTATNGATLKMRYLDVDADAGKYQGHSYCVGVGTPVLMGDGSWLPIEQVRVGDYVTTLEGPRQVVGTVAPYRTPSVLAAVFWRGRFVGSQIQPEKHPVLTPSGWDSYASLAGGQNGCIASVGGNQERAPRPVLFSRVELHARSLRSRLLQRGIWSVLSIRTRSRRRLREGWSDLSRVKSSGRGYPTPPGGPSQLVPDRAFPFSTNGRAYEQSATLQGPDWTIRYSIERGPGGGLARCQSKTCQATLRQLDDAEEPFRRGGGPSGEWDRTRTRTRPARETYSHPYSGEERHRTEDTSEGEVALLPVGDAYVCDLSVASANHYITPTGLVNKNTWEGYDELGEWPSPAPIDKLWACLRSAKGVPCVRRCTGNPGGPGHVWVKKRYHVDQPWVPFEYEPQPGFRDTQGRPLKIQAIFIPSRLDDNPLLMKNDPMYESRLAASGSLELFKAWRYGNWDVLAGQYFDIWNPAEHVVPVEVAKPPAWAKVWISADWGFNDDTVVLWHWADESKRVHTYRELRVDHATPEEIGRRILELNGDEKPTAFYLSPDAFHKRQSPKTIADGISEVLKGKVPYPAHADDDRVGGWQLMYQMLKTGYWKISAACPTLIESLPQLIRDTARNPEDIAESPVDHAPDAARYGLKSMVVASRQSMQVLTEERLKAIPDETSRAIAWQQEAHRRKRWWQGGKMRARN